MIFIRQHSRGVRRYYFTSVKFSEGAGDFEFKINFRLIEENSIIRMKFLESVGFEIVTITIFRDGS